MKTEKPEIFTSFMDGYRSEAIKIEQMRIKKLAAIISLAYAAFAEFEKRIEFGLHLLGEAGYY